MNKLRISNKDSDKFSDLMETRIDELKDDKADIDTILNKLRDQAIRAYERGNEDTYEMYTDAIAQFMDHSALLECMIAQLTVEKAMKDINTIIVNFDGVVENLCDKISKKVPGFNTAKLKKAYTSGRDNKRQISKFLDKARSSISGYNGKANRDQVARFLNTGSLTRTNEEIGRNDLSKTANDILKNRQTNQNTNPADDPEVKEVMEMAERLKNRNN